MMGFLDDMFWWIIFSFVNYMIVMVLMEEVGALHVCEND